MGEYYLALAMSKTVAIDKSQPASERHRRAQLGYERRRDQDTDADGVPPKAVEDTLVPLRSTTPHELVQFDTVSPRRWAEMREPVLQKIQELEAGLSVEPSVIDSVFTMADPQDRSLLTWSLLHRALRYKRYAMAVGITPTHGRQFPDTN